MDRTLQNIPKKYFIKKIFVIDLSPFEPANVQNKKNINYLILINIFIISLTYVNVNLLIITFGKYLHIPGFLIIHGKKTEIDRRSRHNPIPTLLSIEISISD